MGNRFTEKAETALNNAVREAEALGHTYIGSEHILLSLSNVNESTATLLLEKNGINYKKLLSAVKEYSGMGSKSNLTPKDMTPRCRRIVENSYRNSVKYGAQKIGTENILLSILEEKDSIAVKLLSFLNADLTNLTDEIITILKTAEKHYESTKAKKEQGSSYLSQYGKNLTDLALKKKLDPVIGREKETERLIRILSRKTKNNPCLIGEAGVGKTAIVEGLAARISSGDVPMQLLGKKIISVDLTSMVAGAKYRGDFEERIKNLINEASKNKSVILFIDEIHTIVGAGSAEGAIDAANILKPQLSRAEIQLIGATTFSEYHKYIEKDAALKRRFQELIIEEPTVEETVNMLLGLKDRYEKHHNVYISDEAINSAVALSNRYIQDRYFPDKALDVLDEACVKTSMSSIKNLQKNDDNIEQTKNVDTFNINEEYYDLALKLYENEENDISIINNFPSKSEEVKNRYSKLVTRRDVELIINEMTGIPLSGITTRLNTERLRENLKSKVFGQDEAINLLVQAVMRSEAGINNPERPKGVFLFLGGSGVGKTELATALAEELFFSKKSLIRYDMSEFSEKNSVTMLIGSPPGYVGYEEGGALTEKVRRHPYSLLLFDEIEKAHPDVLNLFLQIMDNGILTDSRGRSVSFKNTYIIMTSNAHSGIYEKNLGFLSKEVEYKADALYEYFSPEFLSRIDSTIHFLPLSKSSMKEIVTKRLNEFSKRLLELGVSLSYTEEVSEYIANRATDKKLGARVLLNLITNEIENKVSDLILTQNSESIEISITENEIQFDTKNDLKLQEELIKAK
jgi:ATP-dependent Clp protease ATP-binding subunit ClpC